MSSKRITLVTGASRGVGKGVAIGLGEIGATVIVTGRTTSASSRETATIDQTAHEVEQAGGVGVPIACDHTDDAAVAQLFRRIQNKFGRLDLVVNSVWGGYEHLFEDGSYVWDRPFWEQPLEHWDSMFNAGVRSAYSSSRRAARMMIAQGGGLIVNISYWAAQKYMANVAYGVSKAATDRLTADMALELQPYNVAVVSLYPGLVRTELVMRSAEYLDLGNSESPQFIGRAVAALAKDPYVMQKSGQVFVAASLAEEYGFTDVDGSTPTAMNIDQV